jgi:hypothetical protein
MRHAIALIALVALALPGLAAAKEVTSLNVCGVDGCHLITARAALRAFMNGGYETPAPRSATPFFAVRVHMRHAGQPAGSWTVRYLRAANLLRDTADRGEVVWTRPAGRTAGALRRAARRLHPYPAEQLGPVREPPPSARVEAPPARGSGPAPGGGSSRLGVAGGGVAAALALGGALFARRHRRRAP